MPCYKPIQGFHKLGGGITFALSGSNTIPLQIPCGQCVGCRVDRKKEWALRLSHEMKGHERSCFVTLTYAPESLPRGGTLVKRHIQLFMKSLRQKIAPTKIRYFACGEYGDKFDRPHYHVIIFGWEPSDGKLHSKQPNYSLYTSDILSRIWQKGYILYSAASIENCSYVASYTVKKMRGSKASEHYTRITADGEMVEILPEFALMSTRPGIGAAHYLKYQSDFLNSDTAIMHGRKQRVPRYYDKLLERQSPDALAEKKTLRKSNAQKHRANNTPERLAIREQVAQAKLSFNTQRKL